MKYFHLTTPQRNIWNLQKFYEGTAIANLCGAIFFQERRDSALLREALCQFISSQSGMRLRFLEGQEPMQYVSEEAEEDFAVRSFCSREEFDAFAECCAREPIGLSEGKMYRFVIFHLEQEDRSGILAVLSHLVSDAWTFGLMAHQVDAEYRRMAGEGVRNVCGADLAAPGAECDRACLPGGDYADFIRSEDVYLASARYGKDQSYWEEKYPVRPEESPVKLRSASEDSVEAERITRTLPSSLEQGIISYCGSHPVTEAVLFETALVIYLSRINPDIGAVTVGVPVLNRANAREKQIAGMFVSTIPLTVEVSEKTEIAELAGRITKGHMELFRHQKYPYASILRQLRERQDFSGNLYDVMVSYQNARTKTGADTRWYSNGCSEVPLLIHIDNRDGKECHVINADYQTAVFRDRAEAELLIDRLEFILGQIVSGGAERVGEIGIVPPEEYDRIVNEFNDTYVEYPREKCVHELFMEQAAKTPERTALVFEEQEFTYRELDEMSNSLAYFLREKGIKPNDVVPIIAKRSWHVVVAMLGILKAGGAYMPVDPNFPEDRVASMVEIANSRVALLFACEKELCVETMRLENFDYAGYCAELNNVNCAEDAAYVIFTSGSTGNPKGVTVCHRNVCNYANDNVFNSVCHKMMEHHCRSIVSVTNIVFDIFVTESLLPLVNGMCIYLASEEETVSQSRLSRLIRKGRIDVLQTTPTKMRSYLMDKGNTEYLRGLKTIILGGEAFPQELYHTLRSLTDARIYNIYGPAETTVWSSNAEVTNDITIGTPIANTQIYILDHNLHPVPVGVPGELCIAGEGVGLGYLNRPELTAERFVPNPFATEENRHGKTMYRTGDLARFRSDGEIEYLGRMDTQVKIRGLRIELGEIEGIMGLFDGVKMMAVTDKLDKNGRQFLVGYYTSNYQIDERELRGFLFTKLPKYMIPNYFVRLEKIPVTASGKTDRKRLPLPDFSVLKFNEYVTPESGLEKSLCAVLSRLFSIEQIGVTDNFFDIGGDSLRAIEYVAEAYNEGIEFTPQNVFDYPTVRRLCDFLKKENPKTELYNASDFEKYENLLQKNIISDNYAHIKKSLGNVLVTGATGYLGAHIVDVLLREETVKIYCLVRRSSSDGQRDRLSETLEFYFGKKYNKEIGKRIIPIIGDVENPSLSNNMPDDIHTVIHTAATVKHYGSYEYFYNVNVLGTKNVVNFARRISAKLIHISTLSVSGDALFDQFATKRSEQRKCFSENRFYISQDLSNVYIRSKFEAERVVFDAILGGTIGAVVRVGNLSNRYTDGMFQKNCEENAFLIRMRTFLNLGVLPESICHNLCDIVPVDLCAGAVVAIAQNLKPEYTVFHISKKYDIEMLISYINNIGLNIDFVPEQLFALKLKAFLSNHPELIMFSNDVDKAYNLKYDVNIDIDVSFTFDYLEKIGYKWHLVDQDYMKKYLKYMLSKGFLEVHGHAGKVPGFVDRAGRD